MTAPFESEGDAYPPEWLTPAQQERVRAARERTDPAVNPVPPGWELDPAEPEPASKPRE